ncbi:MAG TPA: hypothetical protein VFF60_11175 [Candidatus Binatus sp.]|nr:hypothetical protein [Candidatus Binatus sp.]
MRLSPPKLIALAAGLLGLVGALLPFYRVAPLIFIGAVPQSQLVPPNTSLAHSGVFGGLVILLAIALGSAPLIIPLDRARAMTGFGLASIVVGMILGDFLRRSMFGRTFALGFYLVVIAFALLAYIYARQAYAPAGDAQSRYGRIGWLEGTSLIVLLLTFCASAIPYLQPSPDIVGGWSGTPALMPEGISQTAGKFAHLEIASEDAAGNISGTLKVDGISGPIVGTLHGRHLSVTIPQTVPLGATYYGMNLEGYAGADSVASTMIESGSSQFNTPPLSYELVLTREVGQY